MEVLGAVGGSVHLAESILKAVRKAKAIRDAPTTMKELYREVVEEQDLLDLVQRTYDDVSPSVPNSPAWAGIGQRCQIAADELHELIKEVLPGEDSKKWRTGMKAVQRLRLIQARKERLEGFKSSLMMTLMLIQMIRETNRQALARAESLRSTPSNIMLNPKLRRQWCHGDAQPCPLQLRALIESGRLVRPEAYYKLERTFDKRLWCQLRHSNLGGVHGRKLSQFRTWHTPSRGSGMFLLASEGDTKGLTNIIQSGRASVDDTTLDGWTALHVAVRSLQVRTVKCLVDHGADVNGAIMVDSYPYHILEFLQVIMYLNPHAAPECIEILRIVLSKYSGDIIHPWNEWTLARRTSIDDMEFERTILESMCANYQTMSVEERGLNTLARGFSSPAAFWLWLGQSSLDAACVRPYLCWRDQGASFFTLISGLVYRLGRLCRGIGAMPLRTALIEWEPILRSFIACYPYEEQYESMIWYFLHGRLYPFWSHESDEVNKCLQQWIEYLRACGLNGRKFDLFIQTESRLLDTHFASQHYAMSIHSPSEPEKLRGKRLCMKLCKDGRTKRWSIWPSPIYNAYAEDFWTMVEKEEQHDYVIQDPGVKISRPRSVNGKLTSGPMAWSWLVTVEVVMLIVILLGMFHLGVQIGTSAQLLRELRQELTLGHPRCQANQ